MFHAAAARRRAALLTAASLCLALASCGRKGQGGGVRPKQEVEVLFRLMQAAWNQVFTQEGTGEYRMARLVLYSGSRDTKCGRVSGGLNYCPEERLVTAAQGWVQSAQQSGGGALHYALARTLARHVQHELTIEERVAKAAEAEPAKKEELLRKREIQTDCFVGLWRKYHGGEAPPLEVLKQAARLWTEQNGDARQRGALQARLEWMQRGFDAGELSACNIFAEPQEAATATGVRPPAGRAGRAAK